MLTSFYTAMTGLNNNGLAISVIGNNLANINTTAFKSSKTSFAELVGSADGATSASGNPIQVGLGTYVPGVSPIFTQGSIQYTGRATDAAITGNGFFVVDTGGERGFTRAGNFGFTSAGELITSDGFKVLGYPAANGVVDQNSPLAPITILKGGTLPARATTDVSITANLDSSAPTDTQFTAAVQAYDSLGEKHTITFTFKKTGATEWDWSATIPAIDTGGAANAAPTEIGNGSMSFDTAGIMTAPTTNPTLNMTGLANGAADMDITFSVLDSNGKPRFSCFASDSAVSSTTQNGYTLSVLRDISIDPNGVVRGIFDNGQQQPLAQLALATFPNVEGMLKFKGSTLIIGATSGEPSIGVAGSGGRGSISGSSLEQSNVDIAQEFTSLIIAQRGYQANSRIINTTDELYQDAINLKR